MVDRDSFTKISSSRQVLLREDCIAVDILSTSTFLNYRLDRAFGAANGQGETSRSSTSASDRHAASIVDTRACAKIPNLADTHKAWSHTMLNANVTHPHLSTDDRHSGSCP